MLTPKLTQTIIQADCVFVPQEWLEKDWNQNLCGASFDTRTLKKEQIFFCWKGELVKNKRADGHSYLSKLRGSSIRLVVVEKTIPLQEIKFAKFIILKVKNSKLALHQIASFIAKNFSGKILAVTGSSGKTTAKNWLATVLAEKYKVLASYKNFNNLIGCPLTLLSLRKQNLAVLEMGTSQKGEISDLVNIVQPHYCVLLNVGLAHLKYFKTIQATYQEKIAIFSSPRLKLGFYSQSLTPTLKQKNLVKFGSKTPYSCELLKSNLKKENTLCKIRFKKITEELELPIFGYHLSESISMLLLVADTLGLSWQQIKIGLKKLSPLAGRMKVLAGKNNRFIIDDSYNANPNSVINLLKSVALCADYKKIVVIGFLAELEKDLKTTAAYLQKNIPKGIDKIYFTGKTGKILVEKLSQQFCIEFVAEEENLLKKLKREFSKNTILAIKGSRAAKLENLLNKIV